MDAKGVGTDSKGFTLLELVLATFISSMVVGMVSVALTFCLQTWEHYRKRTPPDAPLLMDLMGLQVGSFNSFPVRFEGKDQPLLKGEEHSLTLVTDHSVKAVSKGVTVVARYVFDDGEKKLYYAETPLDPYHPEPLEDFLDEKPREEGSDPTFFWVELEDFTCEVEEAEDGGLGEKKDDAVPAAILIRWTPARDDEEEEPGEIVERLVVGFVGNASVGSSWKQQRQVNPQPADGQPSQESPAEAQPKEDSSS